jgi:hypothetical protein
MKTALGLAGAALAWDGLAFALLLLGSFVHKQR